MGRLGVEKLIIRSILVIAGCVFSFGILEITLRIAIPQITGPNQLTHHPELGVIPIPNQRGRVVIPGVFDYTYRNNSYGLRGKAYSFKKSNKYRVLLLGDSFTYGVGVNDNQTFSYHLEKLLKSSIGPTEIINAGIPGSGTSHALKFFNILGK
ncbi:SGNH/GDSL hydrolase family protein, partial [Nitrospinota bacterium]